MADAMFAAIAVVFDTSVVDEDLGEGVIDVGPRDGWAGR